ncbi:MAG: peptide chain release factor-like protein [Elusimicrobia bacterium]|nr:peptide chain release factor-like protein [Elusimicrobiota bacterium]
MNLNEAFDVSPGKLAALKERIARLRIDVRLIEEAFTRGGGKGGQKVNKSSNAVQLKYPPLDLLVRCHRERRRTVNRFLALRELVDRIEMRVSPGTSERLKEIERIRRRKARKKGRLSGPEGSAGGTSCGEGPSPEEA